MLIQNGLMFIITSGTSANTVSETLYLELGYVYPLSQTMVLVSSLRNLWIFVEILMLDTSPQQFINPVLMN